MVAIENLIDQIDARAGVGALVAQDPVELQRMPDRLVDLQHHLVAHEKQIHPPRRAVRS